MFYLTPPAGFPISIADIYKTVKLRLNSERHTSIFAGQISELTNTKYCFFFNLGRTALYHTLKAMASLSDPSKDEVIIPAYTCFTVAAPIARLGLKIRLVDIDPITMDFNYPKMAEVNFKKVLAIVPSNLFGIIGNWDELWAIGRDQNTFIVDDAAQAMGSSFRGRLAGSLGDAGIFSLDRGKPLSTYLGGVMITSNDKIAESVRKSSEKLPPNGIIDEIMIVAKIISYALMLNPRLYWLPEQMPFLKLGQTTFEENFNIGGLSSLQECSGAVMFPKLGNINSIRHRNAGKICEQLSKDSRYRIPGYRQDDCPIYLRLPVLAGSGLERDKAIAALRKRGIKSSAMYPSTIRQIPGIEKYLASPVSDFSGAQAVIDRLFTLPTHHFVKESDISKIVDCLSGI